METPRERFWKVIHGEPTEHVPVWLLFPYARYGSYVDVYDIEAYRPVCELIPSMAITLNRRNVPAPLHTPEVIRSSGEETLPDGRIRKWQTLEYKGRSLTSLHEFSPQGQTLKRKKLLSSDEDLEFYCSLPLETSRERIERHLQEWRVRYERERESFPAEMGEMMLSTGEPIGDLEPYCELDSYAVWSMTHADLIQDFLHRAMERHRIIYEYCLAEDLAPVFFMVGSELAAPPMVRPEIFERWIVPFAQELIDRVRQRGKVVIQHFHGQIRDILDGFRRMHAHALHTIEEPPVGNCTLEYAREMLGGDVTLIGNIQYDELRSADCEQIRGRVVQLLERTRGWRFILSPTAGPFDPEPEANVIDNYVTILQTAYHWHER
ncbi:MAG: hypothetical protein D6820_18855 [Lentisphaerae bacterium]|nr:MAG: hypothetical protein D6820_18855 [Lentisphaerota bacterium]